MKDDCLYKVTCCQGRWPEFEGENRFLKFSSDLLHSTAPPNKLISVVVTWNLYNLKCSALCLQHSDVAVQDQPVQLSVLLNPFIISKHKADNHETIETLFPFP